MPKVLAKIPRSGLGNCMLVWAHALVFARINGLTLITTRWSRIRWGALIRREKHRRFYRNYFRETAFLKLFSVRLLLLWKGFVKDPKFTNTYANTNKYTVFTKRSPDDDLFKHLFPHRDYIKEELINMLSEKIRKQYSMIETPDIGIHIRRGDFKIGNPITGIDFFIHAIGIIRKKFGGDLQVTVFTDAENAEIQEVLDLPKVHLANNKEDILDILQMSKSRFLILSRSSSFGYWAAFLSDATVYMSDKEWQKQIKPEHDAYKEIRLAV